MLFFRKSIKKEFEELLTLLNKTGLHENDKTSARELFSEGERPLALDIICTQLYEFNIQITPEIFNKIQSLSRRLKIKETEFYYLKELLL